MIAHLKPAASRRAASNPGLVLISSRLGSGLFALLLAFVESGIVSCVVPRHHQALQGLVLTCTWIHVSVETGNALAMHMRA